MRPGTGYILPDAVRMGENLKTNLFRVNQFNA